MPSEDFGVFARHVPACFSFIGNGTVEAEGGTPLHSRSYDANDDVLAAGVAFYGAVVRAELGQLGAGRESVSYTHLRAHETVLDLVCRLLL